MAKSAFPSLEKNQRRNFLRTTLKSAIATLTLSSLVTKVIGAEPLINTVGQQALAPIKPDHLIRSVPENMVWGYYGADVLPVARIKDGQVAEIQTINTAGISRKDPEAFFRENNLPIDEQGADIIEIYKKVKPDPSGITGHMLTGPVFVEGAEPGDTLEVRILDIKLRSGYGVNAVWPKGGDLPEAVTARETFVYKYDKKKHTASFKPGVEIPLNPFFGVMAVSPPATMGRVSSIPPGFYGGNMDLKYLVKGTTLYLPVSVPGALFTTGDCHAAQGNGEISGVAIEASLTLVAKFIVRKDKPIKHVCAETPTHFIAIGLDPDLNKAMRNAATQACDFIKDNLGYTFNEALSICSTGVNFEVTQTVDQTLGVHAMIPKSIFTNKQFPYWRS
jgi:acetamidase/formamidase